ncbi:MAG: PEGA domain-containing protein [Deltaproteobacteria bacterium]|nr:MAG: PEGA domain-containing protein [Deltaproteobacteria bacterium]
MKTYRIIAWLILLCFLAGCAANRATFTSVPAGARVLVDGREIGTTPCSLNYRCDGGSERQVTLLLDGFAPVHYTIRSDEVDHQAQAGWITASIIVPLGSPLLIGTLFSKKLKDSYEFVLRPDDEQVASQNPASRIR